MFLPKEDLLLIKGQLKPIAPFSESNKIKAQVFDIENRQCPKRIFNKFGKGKQYDEELQKKGLLRILHRKQIADLDMWERIHEANMDHWIEAEQVC